MQNLFIRAISGSAYVILVMGSCFIGLYGQVFLACFLGASAIIEWMQFRQERHISLPSALMIGILFLGIYSFSPAFDVAIPHSNILQLLMMFLFSVLMISQVFNKSAQVPGKIFHIIFGMVYIGIPMFLLPLVAQMSGTNRPWLLASIFILIWCSDTFAYLVGRFFGKRKLFERISPNKTWEGFIGGVVFTFLGAFLLSTYLNLLSLTEWFGLASIVVIFGSVGDLFESAIKRGFHLKDSGKFLPGHGGILDRIDSLLFVLPLAYFYLRIIETIN